MEPEPQSFRGARSLSGGQNLALAILNQRVAAGQRPFRVVGCQGQSQTLKLGTAPKGVGGPSPVSGSAEHEQMTASPRSPLIGGPVGAGPELSQQLV